MLEWESLSEALNRVRALGVRVDVVRREICEHVAQDRIRVRVLIEGYSYFISGLRAVTVPQVLQSSDFDWRRSRPKEPWWVDPSRGQNMAKKEIALIQLNIFDTEYHLCDHRRQMDGQTSGETEGRSTEAAGQASRAPQSRKRGRPANDEEQRRKEINAVLSAAQREYPHQRGKSFKTMADHLLSLPQVRATRFKSRSTVEQILRGKYPPMLQLNIRSPYQK